MTSKDPPPSKGSRPGARRALMGILLLACVVSTAVLPAFEPPAGEAFLPPVSGWDFLRFPEPQPGRAVYVVNTSGLELSDRFSLVSLQGIVNRERASIYLNTDDPGRPETGWLDANLGGQNYTFSNLTEMIGKYLNRLQGIVIYAEEFPDTINLATSLAGRHDWLICNQTRAREFAREFGLTIKSDLSVGLWAGNPSPAVFYLDAFNRYFPMCDQKALASIDPFLWSSRDWAVSRRLFCFFLDPGPMAERGQGEAFEEIMARSPNATSVVGRLRSDSGMGEDYGVQVISRHGKVMLPCGDTPNLSVLGALGPSAPLPALLRRPAAAPVPENRTYLCFIMSGGDGFDHLFGSMRERWADPERGTLPVGWSVPPALAEAAPKLLEYYYSTATANDSFVAGPSGAATVYPDLYPASRLPVFLDRSRTLMNKAGLESVRLVVSPSTQEGPCPERVLSDYVDYLRPAGIFLECGDGTAARPCWIQSGRVHSGVPVVRSVHMQGSRENAVADILLDAGARPAGPYFIFVTVNALTMGPSDVAQVVSRLAGSPLGPTMEVVAPARLLGLIQADAVQKARRALEEARGDPFARALAGQDLGALERRLGDAENALEDGDLARAAGIASDVRSRAESVLSQRDTGIFALVVAIVVAALAAIVFMFWRGSGARKGRPEPGVPALGLMMAGTYLFLLGQHQALLAGFRDWVIFIAVVPAALAAIPYSNMLARSRYGAQSRRLVAVGNLALGSVLQMGTGWAAALVAFGFVCLLKELAPLLSGPMERALALAGAFIAGCALLNAAAPYPFILLAGLMWLGLFTLWALVLPPALPPETPERKPAKAVRERLDDIYPLCMPAAFLALTAASVYLARKHYLTLDYSQPSSFLLNLGVTIPLGALAIAALLALMAGRANLRAMQPALIMMAGAGWLAVALFRDPVVYSLFILLAQTAMLLLAILSLGLFLSGRLGGERFQLVGQNLVILFILAGFLLLLPVLAWNLYVGGVPLSPNLVTYDFPLAISLFLLVGMLPFTVVAYHFHARDRPEEG